MNVPMLLFNALRLATIWDHFGDSGLRALNSQGVRGLMLLAAPATAGESYASCTTSGAWEVPMISMKYMSYIHQVSVKLGQLGPAASPSELLISVQPRCVV